MAATIYWTIGAIAGGCGIAHKTLDIVKNGLPGYTQLARKDRTGLAMSVPVAGVAALTVIAASGIVTGVAWPVVGVYRIGQCVKDRR